MARYSISHIRKAVERAGHAWPEHRPHHPVITGVRNASPRPNKFDDIITLCVHDGRGWSYFEWAATTDPGLYWLQNPMRPLGTAILPPGQYPATWRLGLHQGSYEALVQRKPLTVIRDGDRDATLDFDAKPRETGLFGINIHRANAVRESVQVDKWSAGCQVIANPHSFAHLVFHCKESVRTGGDGWFDYTLIEEKWL